MFGDDVAALCTVICLTVIWSCVGELFKLKQWVFGCWSDNFSIHCINPSEPRIYRVIALYM